MKKFFNVMLPIFIMVIVACICIGIYFVFTTGSFKKVENNNTTNVDNTTESVVLTQEELPRIGCSGITKQLSTAVIKDFTQEENLVDNVLDVESTEEGFNQLLKDEVDVLISTYPTTDVLTLAKANGIDLEITPIAKDGFVFFTNASNTVDSLKVSDIQKIYTGQIKNWSQIGGDNIDIKAFQSPENSSVQNEMISSVMKNLEMVGAPKDIFYAKGYGEISDLIATYDNTEGALGYSYYYATKILYDTDAKVNNTIKILKLNGVMPSYDTIKKNDYPIISNYYLIRNKNNQSESLNIFTEAVLSERGKNVIKEAGYVEN